MARGQQQQHLRKRKGAAATAKSSASRAGKESAAGTSGSAAVGTRPAAAAVLGRVWPLFTKVVRVTSPAVIGLCSAAAMSSERFAIGYFVVTVFVVFIILFLTFLSILRTGDHSMIHFPTVHKPDGSTFTDEPVSVFEYDKHLAMYYASEIPCFAVAAAWFYLWTLKRTTMLVYAAYVGLRVLRTPVFRVHLWKESPEKNHALRRPFGLAPIFDTNASPVTAVAGLAAFENMLEATPPDALVVVDASATWCGPCKVMAPTFEAMAKQYSSCKFLTVDVEISQDVAKKLDISSIPSFLFYKNGQQLEVIRGASPQKLRTMIELHM